MTTQAQPGKFDRQVSNVSDTDVNWGLLRHSRKTNPWPGPMPNIYEISTDYSYQLDGTGTDIVVVDTGVDAYHPEFLEDVVSSIGTIAGNIVAETPLSTHNSLRGILTYKDNVIAVGDRGEIVFNTQSIQTGQNYSLMDVTVFQDQLYAVGGFYSASVNTQQTPQGPGLKVLTSATGRIWTDATPYGANNQYAQAQLRSAAASNTSLIAVGSTDYSYRRFDAPQYKYVAPTARILRYDGATWTDIATNFTVPLNYNLNRVRYFRDRYIAVGDNGTVIVSGDDGQTWTQIVSHTTCGLHDIVQGANIYVAVGRGGCVITSADNLTWTVRSSSTVADLFAVTYVGDKFIALGQNGAAVWSTDGVTWSTYTTGATNTIYAARGSNLATGASTRVQAFDWSSLGVTGIVSSVAVGGYLGDATAPDPAVLSGGHGTNVTSIAAGRTNGWAKNARIYSIRIFSGVDMTTGSTLGGIDQAKYGQLIRAFHNDKSAPRRPTVANLSLQTVINQTSGTKYVTEINYRGTKTYNNSNTTFKDSTRGLVNYVFPARVSAMDAEIEDAIADGVIIVAAAGNYSYKQDISGGADYDNSVKYFPTNLDYYYMRGCTPAAAGDVICVGALDSSFFNPLRQVREQKANYSHTGPRVDVYAAGSDVMGAYRNAGYGANFAVLDSRSVGTAYSYYLNKISGTSQATPQIAGICAMLAESDPALTQTTMRQRLLAAAKVGQLTVTNSDYQNNSTLPNYSNYSSLLGGTNATAFVPSTAVNDGVLNFINGITGSGEFDFE